MSDLGPHMIGSTRDRFRWGPLSDQSPTRFQSILRSRKGNFHVVSVCRFCFTSGFRSVGRASGVGLRFAPSIRTVAAHYFSERFDLKAVSTSRMADPAIRLVPVRHLP